MKAISKENIKILVVDDEFASRKVLELILKQEGYDVATANGGAQALQLLLSNSYDLITTCIIMPGMNGLEFIEIIKKIFPDIPIIIISAIASFIDMAKEALHLGAFDLITKPVDRDELRKVIDSAFKKRIASKYQHRRN